MFLHQIICEYILKTCFHFHFFNAFLQLQFYKKTASQEDPYLEVYLVDKFGLDALNENHNHEHKKRKEPCCHYFKVIDASSLIFTCVLSFGAVLKQVYRFYLLKPIGI
ncbi:hypothetical protein ACJX0J_034385 [Zea mays]